ncbi:MAG: hypothetical protein K2P81_16790 [Bacteriovoracaceae bacterium]|nr:hypothetical protein [Bacteriovoracaceae bacterium]
MSQLNSKIIFRDEVLKWCSLYQGFAPTAHIQDFIEKLKATTPVTLFRLDSGFLLGSEVEGHMILHGLLKDPKTALESFSRSRLSIWLTKPIEGLSGWVKKEMSLMEAPPLDHHPFEPAPIKEDWAREFLLLDPEFQDTFNSNLHLPERSKIHLIRNANGEIIHLHLWELEDNLYIGHYLWSRLKGIELIKEVTKVQRVGRRRVTWVSEKNVTSIQLHLALGYKFTKTKIYGYFK